MTGCVTLGIFPDLLGWGLGERLLFVQAPSCWWHAQTPRRLQKAMTTLSQVRQAVENKTVARCGGGSSSSAAFCSLQIALAERFARFAPSHHLFRFSHLAAVAHKTLPVKGSAPELAQVWHGGGAISWGFAKICRMRPRRLRSQQAGGPAG